MALEKKHSRAFTLTNAVITMVDFGEEAAVVTVTSTKDPVSISTWMSFDEMHDLGKALIAYTADTESTRR